MRLTLALPVSEASQVGEARRVASGFAEKVGFDEIGRSRVALVATELGQQPASATPIRGELVVSQGPLDGSGRRSSSSRSTAGRAWPTSAGAWSTATPAPAPRATAWGRWPATPTSSTSTPPSAGAPSWSPGSAWRQGPRGPARRPARRRRGLPAGGRRARMRRRLGLVAPAPGRSLLMVADGLGHGPQAADRVESGDRLDPGRPPSPARASPGRRPTGRSRGPGGRPSPSP